MNEEIYGEIEEEIERQKTREYEILVKGAELAFIAGTIHAINRLGRDHGIIADEIIEAGVSPVFPIPARVIPEIIPILKDPAEYHAQLYAEGLRKGGRYINIGKYGAPDKLTGKKPYLGYERKWVSWFEEGNALQREKMLEIIQIGEKRGVWPAMKQLSLDQRLSNAEWIHGTAGGRHFSFPMMGTGYPEGTLADKIHSQIFEGIDGLFNQRKSRASMIARTETQNLRHVAAMDRYRSAGIKRIQWICGPGNCLELCEQFCGQIYDIDDLPFGGEKVHPSCRCDMRPLTGF